MLVKTLICILFLLSTGCGIADIKREVLKHECTHLIEGKLAETNYTRDYVKNSNDWYFLSDEEKRELFNKAEVNDCWSGEIPMEKKYEVGLMNKGEYSFEVKVQLITN